MKKLLCLLFSLILLTIGNVFADEIENAQVIMEKGAVGDIVKLYLIPPDYEDLGMCIIELRFDSGVLGYIDSKLLNASGLHAGVSADKNHISILVDPPITKQVCLMAFLRLKAEGSPSFYLTESYLDKSFNLITERSGYVLWEKVEKNTAIPIEIEPSYSEIEIFIRDQYVLFAEEHDMSGIIWVSAYDEYGNMIDVTSYKPSDRITTKPYSKASFAKVMWWDNITFAPVCDAKTIYFK